MNHRNPVMKYVPVLLAMIFWSFSFIWYKQVFVYYLPVTVILLRLTITVPLLFILSWATGKLQHIGPRNLKWFILLGFFEPFSYFMGESYGVSMISSTLASIIISLIPLLAPIPARILFRERFTLANYVGLIISISGVIMVIMGENSNKQVSLIGVLLMLLAVFSAVFYSVLAKKLSEDYNSFTIVTYQSTFGLLYFIPVFLFTEWTQFVQAPHSMEAFIPIIKLAVFASTFAFLFFVFSIKNLGIARTNVFVNLIPVFTAILAYLILKERFTILKVIGIFIVIGGLIFTQYSRIKLPVKKLNNFT
jgi:drug/metabolite transporter (DMT)-like permease